MLILALSCISRHYSTTPENIAIFTIGTIINIWQLHGQFSILLSQLYMIVNKHRKTPIIDSGDKHGQMGNDDKV